MKTVREIINYLNESNDISILKDINIKNIILTSSLVDFSLFFSTRLIPQDAVKELLDETGLDILSKIKSKEEKISKIFSSKNTEVDLLSSTLISMIDEDKSSVLLRNISTYSSQVQLSLIDKLNLSEEQIKKVLPSLRRSVIEDLLERNKVTSLIDLSNKDLLDIFNKQVKLPKEILNSKDFINRITTIRSPKTYRFLIGNLEENNDVEVLEEKRKEYVDSLLEKYNYETKMLDYFNDFYQEILSRSDRKKAFEEVFNKYFNYDTDSTLYERYRTKFYECIYKDDLDWLKLELQDESRLVVSNSIIDYHFRDIPYNVLQDIKELVSFNQDEKTLTDDKLLLYKQIVELDNTSYEEAIKLHNNLKGINVVEEFYDDIRNAKNRSYEMLNDELLNSETIKKYYVESISRNLGVPIYLLNGDDFKILVKAFTDRKDEPFEARGYSHDGGSFSVDSSKSLITYHNPRQHYNIAYQNVRANQIVHVYPEDSYSCYKRGAIPTDRVNKIMTPDRLAESTKGYNELVIAVPNRKKNTELDQQLVMPEILGIYCYDEITEKDIESAKNLGTGVIIVNTKKYPFANNDNYVPYHEQDKYIGSVKEDNDRHRIR